MKIVLTLMLGTALGLSAQMPSKDDLAKQTAAAAEKAAK